MDDLPPGSRLAHVRSELAMDSESEESESATPTNADTAKTETEPFPEYDESECEMLASSIAADKRREEAWIHALGKATQRENRMLHVDPNIIPYFQSDPSHRSQVVLEQLRDLLADPQMRPKIRDQFITMINATLQFNLVIFHQSSEFLAPKEIEDAELHLESVLNLVEWMEEDLRDQLETAEQVSYAIEGASLQPTSAYERLCKMASLFANAMKKPRYLERRLLSLYMDMYEEWVHTPFLLLRNRQLVNEQDPSPERTKLSRRVIMIWDLMNSCIESYGTLTWFTLEIKHQYFAPVMGYLCDSPEIWQYCWDQYQALEKDRAQASEKDLSQCATI
ncbi:hypothetical protein E8E15_006867 [Penicillium rubens]|uniref:Pc20g01490 protein n=2 Tax=Penicillium chrysogenum species complex TaxID=254878 RepID=B6HDF6_PENRW|nr:uncharacterized protein N7525_008602 [Penicillium rubens]XP_056572300.1 uncharacterized protein N7489_002243 [Penicillium chrysogenum]CAP85478.1 Pc20g01490 [Penicillium rubens Wisconsin 54-1255]KAF3019585.1 hypothetical protein E8E15_006867 [Penicillium rubens]KAJ5048253.1 hypothetical protein NUH16_006751 [Penicillium rubens]KAJ5248425.1 hypothetical protein N7524_012385 [Penicillium chrysogenum]KAJ5251833.1 hypothetical protein N7489_002243 [Penicillium chrysogenum]